MPIFNNILAGASGQATGYDIDQSLRFEDGDNAYLTRTPGSDGNRKIWTWSGWVKRGNVGTDQQIFSSAGSSHSSGADISYIGFRDVDDLVFYHIPSGGSAVLQLYTDQLFRDPSAWYHLVFVLDTTQAVAANRAKIYVNGEQVTDFSSSTYPSQDYASAYWNSTRPQVIGNEDARLRYPYDGYLAEVYFIDGQALTPASFGETNSATNQWVPIEVTGMTYGTNGFYQKYSSTELANSFSNDTNSDAFVPSANLTVNYLVVAGGGSGGAGDSGNYGGGGGGAGGLLSGSTSVTSGTSYPITVGAGGDAIAPSASSGSKGNDGSNSIFSSFTAIGGGGGGFMSTGGNDGGSGGGDAGGGGGGGDGTSGQGNDGGDHNNYLGAGGGGAGGAGQTRSGTTGGVGGAGADHSGTFGTGYGVSGFFAGGGGGGYTTGGGQGTAAGAGGSGGGGAGGAIDGTSGATTPGTAGTANTGGGGGGGSAYHSGSTSSSDGGSGAGGSGVVLIRYAGSSPQATGGTISTVNISGTDYQVHAFTNIYNDHTITANGDVTNTRAQKKIGNSSIKFDGTGDFLTSPHSSDWGFGTGEFTLEMWIRFANKKTGSGAAGSNALIANHNSPNGWQWIYRGDDETFDFWSTDQDEYNSSATTLNNDTWYHIAVTRDGNTLRHYVDGVQKGSNAFTETMSDTSTTLQIGSYDQSGLGLIDGYMDEIRISDTCRYPDGTTFTPSTTAFTADSNTKLLIHSNWEGGLGGDSSGNDNDFSINNLVATDQVVDSPTNNFATLNPLVPPATTGSVFSEGNLKYRTYKTGGDNVQGEGSIGFTSGKWYWEIYLVGFEGSTARRGGIGVGDAISNETWTTACTEAAILAVGNLNPQAHNVVNASTGSSWSTGAAGDIWCCAFDADAGTFIITKNTAVTGSESDGKWTGFATSTVGYRPITVEQSASDYTEFVYNFGQDSSFAGAKTAQGNQDGNGIGDFYYTPPSGYLALCSDNLSDPSIADPTAHFNSVLYTGTGGTRSISGVGFQPDFTWIKSRSNTYQHMLFDSVRGATKYLVSDATDAEATDATQLTAFDSDGFSLGSGSVVNGTSATFVGWNWKAGGTASSNSDGTETVSLSANPTAGFSIIAYTGTGTTDGSDTVGHGLSQAPELYFVKARTEASHDWNAYAKPIGVANYVALNLNGASAAQSNGLNHDEAPTSSVITLGSWNAVNESAKNFVIYAFHSVEGYSKVGSYVGNSNSDGPFIYTGFRPAFIMVKLTTAAHGEWVMFDNKRDPDNATDRVFYANLTAISTDVSSYSPYDILSNGFKSRIPGGNGNEASYNSSGQTYLYLAFAESPFKYSNAR